MSTEKKGIGLTCDAGIWTVSTVFYGVHMYSSADHLTEALRGLRADMKYVERELVIRVGGIGDKS